MREKKTGLVLEGGGMRGIYTAGVLDVFMENGITFDDRHIVEDNPTAEELKAWWEKSGLPLKKFFNTSGLVYKEQNLKERLPNMSELALLATNGMLVKRPLVIGEDFVLIGFKEAEWERLK